MTALIGRVIEMKCAGLTPKGSVRHEVFVRFRDDKETHASA
jgi:ATP-dependent DNA ligase